MQNNRNPVVMAASFILAAILSACGSSGGNSSSNAPGSDGPQSSVQPVVHAVGNAASGREVFRFETFGTERFWTDAVRLPQGIVAARVTPIDALKLGLSVDIERLDAATAAAVAAELKTDLSPANAPLLNNPATTLALLNANAVIGVVVKDSNGDGKLDVASGDKVGVTCALCHTITDKSVFNLPAGGSIGKRIDGPAVHTINIGKIFAVALNSRALYPGLQLALTANGGKTLGRAPTGLTEKSTEAEVDAYLSNPAFYPIGMFDDTFDGNGDPMKNVPFLRTDLAAPWGSDGTIARLDNFNNLVFTGLFDMTTLTTPNGRAFLRKLGGTAAGNEIADDYVKILAETGVTGYPYVIAAAHPAPGTEEAPLGIRVDNQKLLDLNAYTNSLQSPPGVVANAESRTRGRQLFRENCTGCHNVDQTRPVPAFVVAMKDIFPGDNPVTLLPSRDPPLNPILDTPGVFFDDKMAVVNASLRGDKRGNVMPLLVDLARSPSFLHDRTVPTLDALLNPSRGATMPHPFYLADPGQRADVAEYLRSLDTITGGN